MYVLQLFQHRKASDLAMAQLYMLASFLYDCPFHHPHSIAAFVDRACMRIWEPIWLSCQQSIPLLPFGGSLTLTLLQGCLDAPSVAESFSDKKYWIVPDDFEFLSAGSKSRNHSDSAQV
jgi:hypothetical protein